MEKKELNLGDTIRVYRELLCGTKIHMLYGFVLYKNDVTLSCAIRWFDFNSKKERLTLNLTAGSTHYKSFDSKIILTEKIVKKLALS